MKINMRWIGRHLEEILCVAFVSVMSVTVVLQVFFRLALRYPLAWTEELATILFLWVVMIGSSLALKSGDHFAVELLHRRLRPTDRHLAGVLVSALVIVFSLLLIVEGGRLTWLNRDVATPAMEISRAFAYGAIPVGGLLMLARSIEILLRHARGRDEPQDEISPHQEIIQ